MKDFDAIIIGAGQAGPSMARRLTAAGMKVAFVERGLFGGTCVNTGCTPTKAMVASAYVAHMARRASEYGVVVGANTGIDMKAVIARREAIVSGSRNGVEASLRGDPKITVFVGTAEFESAHVIRIGEERIRADRIFINLGARASIPDLPGVRDVPYLTNSSLLRLEVVPEHLVIIGGSYVGIEFGQMYRRFGSKVTIIEKAKRIVSREDPDVSAAVLEILEGEGIHIRLESECITFAPHDHGVAVGVSCLKGEELTSTGLHVLLAVGRMPNTDDLGLDKAGIITDKQGYITVDERLQTSVSGVYALGDCNRKGAFTHTAYNDYEIVAANLLDGDARRVSDRIPCYAMYCDPPLARIGLTEEQVRTSGKPALIGTRSMKRINRALEKGESLGFMKILVDAESKQILGASLLGVGCDEAIHSLLDVMYAKAPYTTISRAVVHIHPTVSELIPTVLQSLKPL
jgi:pyruvate/2-oxoglutarate dehydrogenase complex dihydrolipoamide dehydrogenase (E3) component